MQLWNTRRSHDHPEMGGGSPQALAFEIVQGMVV